MHFKRTIFPKKQQNIDDTEENNSESPKKPGEELERPMPLWKTFRSNPNSHVGLKPQQDKITLQDNSKPLQPTQIPSQSNLINQPFNLSLAADQPNLQNQLLQNKIIQERENINQHKDEDQVQRTQHLEKNIENMNSQLTFMKLSDIDGRKQMSEDIFSQEFGNQHKQNQDEKKEINEQKELSQPKENAKNQINEFDNEINLKTDERREENHPRGKQNKDGIKESELVSIDDRLQENVCRQMQIQSEGKATVSLLENSMHKQANPKDILTACLSSPNRQIVSHSIPSQQTNAKLVNMAKKANNSDSKPLQIKNQINRQNKKQKKTFLNQNLQQEDIYAPIQTQEIIFQKDIIMPLISKYKFQKYFDLYSRLSPKRQEDFLNFEAKILPHINLRIRPTPITKIGQEFLQDGKFLSLYAEMICRKQSSSCLLRNYILKSFNTYYQVKKNQSYLQEQLDNSEAELKQFQRVQFSEILQKMREQQRRQSVMSKQGQNTQERRVSIMANASIPQSAQSYQCQLNSNTGSKTETKADKRLYDDRNYSSGIIKRPQIEGLVENIIYKYRKEIKESNQNQTQQKKQHYSDKGSPNKNRFDCQKKNQTNDDLNIKNYDLADNVGHTKNDEKEIEKAQNREEGSKKQIQKKVKKTKRGSSISTSAANETLNGNNMTPRTSNQTQKGSNEDRRGSTETHTARRTSKVSLNDDWNHEQASEEIEEQEELNFSRVLGILQSEMDEEAKKKKAAKPKRLNKKTGKY